MAATRVEELADMRQENVSFADVVAQDGMAWTKSIQEGVPREASKLGTADAVPDSKIYVMRHKLWHLVNVPERARTAARATVEKSSLR